MSAQPAAPMKETKAQRAERLKQQKNPWECFEEIRQFAARGHAAIPDEWLKTYFRWWGVYTQGDGAGAIGGTGGEGKVKIGRASCRERVEISVVAVSLKKKEKKVGDTDREYIARTEGNVNE